MKGSAMSMTFSKIPEYERMTEKEAKLLYQELCQLNNNQHQIDLNFIRRLLSLGENKYPENFLKFITQYKLIDALREGNFSKENFHNVVFNEEEFVDLVTGKETKDLLFNKEMDFSQKRFKIDEYYKLFELMKGDNKGISRENLKRAVEEVLTLLNNGSQPPMVTVEEQTDEIIQLLGSRSDEDGISIEDFMNIMTSDAPLPGDLDEVL